MELQRTAISCAPATTRSPQPHAELHQHGGCGALSPLLWQREPALHSGLNPSAQLPVQGCVWLQEGLEQILTLWLPQCVTVAWFSEREGRKVLSVLQGGHVELAPEPCSHALFPQPAPSLGTAG